jgi:hypothetical protein
MDLLFSQSELRPMVAALSPHLQRAVSAERSYFGLPNRLFTVHYLDLTWNQSPDRRPVAC